MVLFTPLKFYGQNQLQADSLIKVLEKQTLSDSLRLFLLSEISKKSSRPEDKIHFSEQLLDLAIKNNNPEYIQSSYVSLGTAHRLKGDLEKSVEYLFKGASIAKENMLWTKLGETYAEISSTFLRRNNDVKNSLFYGNKAIEIFEKSGDHFQLALTLLNTGYSYYLIGGSDSALLYSNRAEMFFDTTKFNLGKAYAVGNKALIYASLGDLGRAEIDLQKSLEILRSVGDYYAISDYLNQLGNLYYNKGSLEEAIKLGLQSLEISKEGNFKEQIRDGYYILFQAYRDLGFYQDALTYHTKYIAVKDSITNAESIQKMADQRTQFEVGQKQAEVDLLTAEKKIREVMLTGAVAFSVILVILAAIIYKYYQNKNKVARILESQKLELERLNHTKDKFFSIISHDLRGPVSSFFGISHMIKYLVKSKNTDQLIEVADDIDKSVERLSSLLDNLLNWAMQQQGHIPNVPEKLDFNTLASDLTGTFKTMADSKKISLKVEVDGEPAIWADRNMTMTIFRNLLNNALKFTEEGGTVTLFAREADGYVSAGIRDTGVGIPREKLNQLFTLGDKKSTYGTSGEKGLGLGLQLVYEFIEINNGKIEVESEPGSGTVFLVSLPAFSTDLSSVGVG